MPTLLITPFFRPNDGKLVFQIHLWGVGASNTDKFDIPEIEPTDFQRQFTNLDDYENNYMNLGTYQFMVSVQDSSSNKVSVKFNIYVRDYTAPIIKLEQYVILTEKGKPIAKEQIIELFQTLGYSIDGSMMNSECFSLDALDGEYPLEIELETGDIEHDIISTERDMNISFDEPIKDENNINLALILSLSIGGFLLLSIGTMGIIIYKKRH